MNDENLEQMSVIGEAEESTLTPEESKGANVRRLTPDEPTSGSGGGGFVVALIVIAIIALLGTCVYGVLGGGSKGEKFIKMLTDDYIFEMPLEMVEVRNNDGKVISETSVDAATIFGMLGVEIDSIDDIAVVTEQNKKGEDVSGKVSIELNSSEIVSVGYAKTGDLFGIKVPDLIEEYIVVENDNLKALAEKFGLSGEELDAIPNKITAEELEKTYSEALEAQSVDSKKLEKILKKYKKPLINAIENNLVNEKNQALTIENEEISLTKHTLSLSEKALYEVVRDLLEIAQNDEDLYELINEQDVEEFEYESFEEWQSNIVYSLEQAETEIESASDAVLCELNVYEKGGNTYAIELAMVEEDVLVRLAGLNKENNSYIEVVLAYTNSDDENVKFIYETEKTNNKYESDFTVSAVVDSIDVNLNIFKYTLTFENTASLEQIKVADAFVLNDEDMTAIENKMTEISGGLPTYIETISQRLPAELLGELTAVEYDYDSSTEENTDFDYDYDYSEEFELQVDQIYVLADSDATYENIKLNSTKDEVMALMGEPTYEDSYEDEEYYYWSDEYFNDHSVNVENGVVVRKGRSISSSSYDGIKLSSEIGTTLADLNAVIDSVEEGMTLSQIEAILGDKYIEVGRNTDGECEYTWFDVAENNVTIEFDANNVATYVPLVWPSF